MKRFCITCFLLLWTIPNILAAEPEVVLGPESFQLVATEGAEAESSVGSSEEAAPSIQVIVRKPGQQFWSVELRRPGLKLEKGKQYQLNFRAKGEAASSFVYFVLERENGNQGSIAEGTMLQLSSVWRDCTVAFLVTETAETGRLTISSLSVRPTTFRFSNFKLGVLP